MKKLTPFLIVGAAVGAAIWFFNTKKGKEVLEGIKDTSGDLADKIKSGISSAKHATAGIFDKSKQYVNNMNNKVQEAAN